MRSKIYVLGVAPTAKATRGEVSAIGYASIGQNGAVFIAVHLQHPRIPQHHYFNSCWQDVEYRGAGGAGGLACARSAAAEPILVRTLLLLRGEECGCRRQWYIHGHLVVATPRRTVRRLRT